MKSKKRRTPKHFWIYAWRGARDEWLPCNPDGVICTVGNAPVSLATEVVIEFTKKAAMEKVRHRTTMPSCWTFIKISLED